MMVCKNFDTAELLIQAEIPIVKRIISDETWYESERRGYEVYPDDTTVLKRVCKIIQRNDKYIRQQALRLISDRKQEE